MDQAHCLWLRIGGTQQPTCEIKFWPFFFAIHEVSAKFLIAGGALKNVLSACGRFFVEKSCENYSRSKLNFRVGGRENLIREKKYKWQFNETLIHEYERSQQTHLKSTLFRRSKIFLISLIFHTSTSDDVQYLFLLIYYFLEFI